ncbi:cation transporter [Nonomuraea sp. NPDC051941]|uniref:cation transporter n=1 Tax=Nonomuraea sp. NPDC051941 TaxID=3364373 RepID=UPI0037CB3254
MLDVSGLRWASEQNVVVATLSRRPGVLGVEANPVAQTATVEFDPRRTSLAELRAWLIECGYHCAGQSVPSHICDPMAEPDPPRATPMEAPHAGHAAPAEEAVSPHEMMGHGGHAGMSMASIAAVNALALKRLRLPTS